MVCQIILQKKQAQPHQSVYLAELLFETTGDSSEERSVAVGFLSFPFYVRYTVDSVETWWMCFHLCRMMPSVEYCSISFSREMALIPVDIFIILCSVFMVLLLRVFVCPLQES